MKRFITWLVDRFYDNDEDDLDLPVQSTAPRVKPRPVKPKRAAPNPVAVTTEMEGKIEDGGPGKNVLVKNKYLREDTGTHETLKIVDESILNSNDEDGIDPYNTGRFDRSKSWDSFRSRK